MQSCAFCPPPYVGAYKLSRFHARRITLCQLLTHSLTPPFTSLPSRQARRTVLLWLRLRRAVIIMLADGCLNPAVGMRNDSFKDFVLDQLQGLDGVDCRAMFGGHGLYQGKCFFGILFKGRLYLKTSAETRADYEARAMMPFRPSAQQTLKNYYEVPADVIENRETLVAWARKAIDVSL